MISRPYSIGYSVLEIAIAQFLPMASMINKAGSTVVARSQSVAFAIMDKGGNLNSLLQANLADGASSSVWPISGFTYFIIRNNHHISSGNCPRRSAAMEYLYDFYNSDSVATAAQNLGFAVLPQFIASIIVSHLVNYAKCDDGTYALAKYRTTPSPLLAATVIRHTVNEYLSAYSAVDASTTWSFKYADNSPLLYRQFLGNPSGYSGIFSMFPTQKDKLMFFNRTDILTSAFCNMAVVPLYHINAYTLGNNGNNPPLQLTAEIMGGILSGAISNWNDTRIQMANPLTKMFLPNMTITVVVRPYASDTSALLLRFLTAQSPTFLSAYQTVGATSTMSFNFSSVIPLARLKYAVTNVKVDSIITTFDGSFGYYLQNAVPSAAVASYCTDATCSEGPISPASVSAIHACEADTSTVINPRDNLYTFDLMASSAKGCYPIVGTVDYSLLATTDSTCSYTNTSAAGVLRDRIQFSAWLYSSSVIAQPLQAISIGASPVAVRLATYDRICGITCNNEMYGYNYCGYRDCSWKYGDYTQSISKCDTDSDVRTVSYSLINGANNTCVRNPRTIPPETISISCSDISPYSKGGRLGTALASIGMITCILVVAFMVLYREEKTIKKSQPIFIYIFITGAFFMNMSILTVFGPNDDRNCLLRPWAIDISTTVMFAPLLMKLHRIDVLFCSSKKLKKTKIPDYYVSRERILSAVFVIKMN